MNAASNSVGQIASLGDWCAENWRFLSMRVRGMAGKESEIDALAQDLRSLAVLYESLTGQRFESAKVFEVGHGARPLRLMLLSSMGIDARGIDLDAVSLAGSGVELLRVLRRNGVRRFVKTFVRSALFDSHERRALRRVLGRSGHALRIDPERFLVGDVADYRLPPASLDIIYSEDVFEHIPGLAIDGVCQGMARALRPGGVAFISPLVYTSLIGGHLSEWYGVKDTLPEGAHSAPWEHLRQRRVKADCYLNEWRLADYQRAFGNHFEVLEVINLQPEFGSSFLNENIRRELSVYAEHELLGSKWRFVLRKRAEVAE